MVSDWRYRGDAMTSRERLDALLSGKSVDHVGLFLFARGFCAKSTGIPLSEFYTDPKKSLEAQTWVSQMYGQDEPAKFGFATSAAWDFGAENIEFRTSTPTSSNQVISPKHFQEFSLPYLKELHEKVLDMGVKYLYTHICGEQNLNLPYYAEIPFGDPGIASFGHEVDLPKAIEYLGDKCIIVGNVEPSILLTGTPDEVYQISKACIEKAKSAPRGFILGSGCELPPMAPPCNVWAMRKAINDFGWYG